MARFVDHSSFPRAFTPLFALVAMIAFAVFAVQVKITDRQLVVLLIVIVPVLAAAGLALFERIDARMRRVCEVTPLEGDEKRAKKLAGFPGRRGTATKKVLREMDWDIGPRGGWRSGPWKASLGLTGVAAVVFTLALVLMPRGHQPAIHFWTAVGWCIACVAIQIAPLWTSVVRFRINGQIITIERPFSLFRRACSFYLSEIEEADVSHSPHDRKFGKCLTITLHGGRRIKYSDSDRVIGKVVRQLRLAIEESRQVPHPLSDESIR
jgi:hypothetical protein